MITYLNIEGIIKNNELLVNLLIHSKRKHVFINKIRNINKYIYWSKNIIYTKAQSKKEPSFIFWNTIFTKFTLFSTFQFSLRECATFKLSNDIKNLLLQLCSGLFIFSDRETRLLNKFKLYHNLIILNLIKFAIPTISI